MRTNLLTTGAYQLLWAVLLIAASASVPRHSISSSSRNALKVPAGTVTFSHPTYCPLTRHAAKEPVLRFFTRYSFFITFLIMAGKLLIPLEGSYLKLPSSITFQNGS